MSLVKFQILKYSGKWDFMSPDQEQSVALTYEVTTIKEHNLKLAKSDKSPKNNNTGDNTKEAVK
jgi:hypothetical protein